MAAASLGSATGSRVDSAAKHTMPCKIDSKFFRAGLTDTGTDLENTLHQQKMEFMMQKDEIVMNTTKKIQNFPGSQAFDNLAPLPEHSADILVPPHPQTPAHCGFF